MKNSFRTILISLVIGFSAVLSAAAGQFYVVVGSFSKEDAAEKFAASIEEVFTDVSVTFDGSLNLYHVYVMESDRHDIVESFRDNVRRENGFSNAWVYATFDNREGASDGGASSGPVKLELYTGNTVLLAGSSEGGHFAVGRSQQRKDHSDGLEVPFEFVAKNASGLRIPGKVVVMNRDGVVISTFKTGERVYFSGQYGSQKLVLMYQSHGFSPETRVIDLASLGRLRHVHQNGEGAWEVLFHAVRLDENSINLRYQNCFHRDAAIIQGRYREELDLLVSVMKENPEYRVVINSHCNGAPKREILLPGKERDYFDTMQAVEKSGNDKVLTKERANVLRDYMIERGIEAHRISAMGWGNLDPLVKGAEADMEPNERVEVELVRK